MYFCDRRSRLPGMKRLLLISWLVAAAAHGQDTTPPRTSTADTVEVVGHQKLGKEVQSFVSKLTQLDGELVSSWETPICPTVVADDPAHAEYIRARLLEIAAEIPFAVESDEKCRANLFVVLTGTPEEFLAEWKERDPGMFIWRARRGVSRGADSLPVRTWHNVAVEPAGGAPAVAGAGAIPSVGAKSSGLGAIPVAKAASGGSRLVSTVSENLKSVLVLVDTNQAAGVTLRQLGDYIAMVSFSKVDVEADFGGTNTILRLFAANDGIARPGSLTMWDRAFLRGLYRQSIEAAHQRMAISSRMVRDLQESATQDTAP